MNKFYICTKCVFCQSLNTLKKKNAHSDFARELDENNREGGVRDTERDSPEAIRNHL